MPYTPPLAGRARRLLAPALTLALIAGWPAPPASASGTQNPTPVTPATFTVNSTADTDDGACTTAPGGCTLREAIKAVNKNMIVADPLGEPEKVVPNVIAFNIPGAGVQKIAPATPLPPVLSMVRIDGYTQPGARPNRLAEGDNAKLLVELDGSNLPPDSDSSGLQFYAMEGGFLRFGNFSEVRGLIINRFPKAGVDASRAFGVKVKGNFIGTDPAGTAARGNGVGVMIYSQSSQVGGTTPAERNVISGNSSHGVSINSDLGDIAPFGPAMTIRGNYIGTDAGGTAPLGNGEDGVFAAHNSLIGGEEAGAGNRIAFNKRNGVLIPANSSLQERHDNRVVGNSIFSNGGLGIKVLTFESSSIPDASSPALTAVTPNDVSDAGDLAQNFPVISRVTAGGGSTTVAGTLESRPNEPFTLHFYANASCDPSGYGEGQTYLGSAAAETDGAGVAAFSATLPSPLPAGQLVTATATTAAAAEATKLGTSEFSPCMVAAPPQGVFQFSRGFYAADEGGGLATFHVVRVGGSRGAASVSFSTAAGTALGGGADFANASGTLTFAHGETLKSFDVPLRHDLLDEPDESFRVTLSGATGGAVVSGQSSSVLTIFDDDDPPAVSAGDVSVTEGNSGRTDAVFTVSLSAPPVAGVVVVNYSTAPGTATSGSDFQPALGRLTFAPGEAKKTVAVRVAGDALPEANETFFIRLTLEAGTATVKKAKGVCTILDDEKK